MRHIEKILFATTGRVSNRQSDFEAAVHNWRRSLAGQLPGRRNVLDHIVFQVPLAVNLLETTRHDRKQFHFLFHQFVAGERGILVWLGIEQTCHIRGKSNLHNHHRSIRLPGQYFAQQLRCLGRIVPAQQVVRITELAVVPLCCQNREFARLGCRLIGNLISADRSEPTRRKSNFLSALHAACGSLNDEKGLRLLHSRD